MFLFLIPLLLGFTFNAASAFTSTYFHKWGERRGSIVSVVLRDVLGIPVWTVGFGMAFLTPSWQFFATSIISQVLGWFLIGGGGAIILAALFTIRTRSVRPSTRDTLAEDGLYAWVRHPIHSGTLLEFVGLFFIRPTQVVVITCALGILWVFIQTWLEERDLLQRMPDYREYRRRVPLLIPHFKGLK